MEYFNSILTTEYWVYGLDIKHRDQSSNARLFSWFLLFGSGKKRSMEANWKKKVTNIGN